MTDMADRQTIGKGGWPGDRAADPAGLLDDVERLLIGVGLLRVVEGWWWLSPVTGRWEAPPNSASAPPRMPVPTRAVPVESMLYDTNDESAEEGED